MEKKEIWERTEHRKKEKWVKDKRTRKKWESGNMTEKRKRGKGNEEKWIKEKWKKNGSRKLEKWK